MFIHVIQYLNWKIILSQHKAMERIFAEILYFPLSAPQRINTVEHSYLNTDKINIYRNKKLQWVK